MLLEHAKLPGQQSELLLGHFSSSYRATLLIPYLLSCGTERFAELLDVTKAFIREEENEWIDMYYQPDFNCRLFFDRYKSEGLAVELICT